jgi:hypothetical protein
MEQNKIVSVVSPSEMIMAAVTANTDLDKLQKLMELQFKWESEQARKAYADDFASAQADIEPAVKNLKNKQTNSSYADLSGVIECAQPVYTKYGFSVKFNEGDCPKEGHIRVLAEVQHRLGYSEHYHKDVPIDGKGLRGNENMTQIHGNASSFTYGRRYLMCMIWNIPTADNDGNKTSTAEPFINEKQLSQILDLLAAKELPEKGLLEYMKVAKLEDIFAKDYHKAVNAIAVAKKVGK